MKSKFHGVSDEQLLKERSNLARRLAACRGALTDLEAEIHHRNAAKVSFNKTMEKYDEK
jgi:hypothetical protein